MKNKIEQLKDEHESAILLDRVLDWAIANRNSEDSEFVKCYTYDSGMFPKIIIDIKKYLNEEVGRKKYSIVE